MKQAMRYRTTTTPTANVFRLAGAYLPSRWWIIGLLFAAACQCREPTKAPATAPSSGDEVKPTFADKPAQVLPEAKALCDALHTLPAERKAACCSRAAGVHFADECARTLSLAVEGKGVVLSPADSCVAELKKLYSGCDWVGPNAPELPAACANLIKGQLGKGSKCRSSLECIDGLRCQGQSPTQYGACQPPGEAGLACELSVDTLASYVRQPLTGHRECMGFCQRHRCQAPLAREAACTIDDECGAGNRCVGRCEAGTAGNQGQRCVPGGCASPLRCVAGVCAAPKREGESCVGDLECLGACVDADGGRSCGKRC